MRIYQLVTIVKYVESDSENETEIFEDEKPACSLIEACDMVKRLKSLLALGEV